MTNRWISVEQYVTVVLFVFQFCQVCNFGKFIFTSFGLGTVRSERVKFCYFNLMFNVNSTALSRRMTGIRS